MVQPLNQRCGSVCKQKLCLHFLIAQNALRVFICRDPPNCFFFQTVPWCQNSNRPLNLDSREMESLPAEIYVQIFNYLPVNEAIKCRTVCKLWRQVLDQFVLVELNLFFYQPLELNQWIFHPSFYQPDKLLHFKFQKVIENENFRFVFRNLKKLYVFQTELTPYDEQFISMIKIYQFDLTKFNLPNWINQLDALSSRLIHQPRASQN